MPTQDTEFAAAARTPTDVGEEELQRRLAEERLAVARDLHDDVGGALAALRFDLSWLAHRTTDPEVQQRLRQAGETLQEAIAATQKIALDLRSSPLDDGLVAALHDLAAAFEQRTAIRVTLSTSHDIENLPEALQRVVYRIAREALTNVGKHARAREASIAASITASCLRLTIEDDGIGMLPRDAAKPAAFGLQGMRERAEALGGTIDAGPRRGGGTSIALTLPITAITAIASVSTASPLERHA
ncbi:MAG: sensor histidine kinase [Steroidobacteraceae bacterium]